MPLRSKVELQEAYGHLKNRPYLWKYILIREPGYSFLAGTTFVGKTNLALQIGAHIGLGLPLLGSEVNKGKVALVCYEGSVSNILERMDKLEAEMGGKVWDNFQVDFLEPTNLYLMMKNPEKYLDSLKGYDLVILDNFSILGYGDWTTTIMGAVNRDLLLGVSRYLDAHLLVLCHIRKEKDDDQRVLRPGHIDKALGSGLLPAGATSVMMLEREVKDDRPRKKGQFTPVRKDFLTLFYSKLWASPDGPWQQSLFFNRNKLQYEVPEWEPVI